MADDIAGLVEELTGVPPAPPGRLTREERQKQAERVSRFLAFPPQLQEGILRYGESLRQVYAARKT